MPRHRRASPSETAMYVKLGAIIVAIVLLLIFGLWSFSQSGGAGQ